MLEVEDEGVLTLGASYHRSTAGGGAQIADGLYYASGGYNVALTLYQLWPVEIGGRASTLVWRGDFISATSLGDLHGIERLASESAMRKDILKAATIFQREWPMNSRFFALAGLISSVFVASVFAGSGKDFSAASDAVVEEPYKFSAEFTIEQAYVGGADVQRAGRVVSDYDEYYSNVSFIYTPRIKFGILRLGAQWERFSFGFPTRQSYVLLPPPSSPTPSGLKRGQIRSRSAPSPFLMSIAIQAPDAEAPGGFQPEVFASSIWKYLMVSGLSSIDRSRSQVRDRLASELHPVNEPHDRQLRGTIAIAPRWWANSRSSSSNSHARYGSH